MLDVEKDFIQITGREALDRLLVGETVYSYRGNESFKIIDGELRIRDYSRKEEFEKSSLELNMLLDPKDNDWYIEPPFSARKEMLKRPDQWVAKNLDLETNTWNYIGFSSRKMHAAKTNDLLKKFNEVIEEKEVSLPTDEELENAVPLEPGEELALKLQ